MHSALTPSLDLICPCPGMAQALVTPDTNLGAILDPSPLSLPPHMLSVEVLSILRPSGPPVTLDSFTNCLHNCSSLLSTRPPLSFPGPSKSTVSSGPPAPRMWTLTFGPLHFDLQWGHTGLARVHLEGLREVGTDHAWAQARPRALDLRCVCHIMHRNLERTA